MRKSQLQAATDFLQLLLLLKAGKCTVNSLDGYLHTGACLVKGVLVD